MILRSIGVRHGRRALSTPLARAGLRRLTTEDGPKPAVAPQPVATAPPQTVDPVARYERRNRLKKTIRPIGSDVDRQYQPDELIRNPLAPRFLTLERLMAAQTHMGHHASLWNPANSRYIYGVRQGIHIISLETTAAHLRRAATVVEEVSYRGGLVLFVGTRRGQMEVVTEAAREARACHLFTKWTPGAITNRDIILRDRGINVINEKDEILPGFDKHIQQTRPLIPDLVVCLNPLENYTMLYECGLAGIPTIGVIDTDADPSWVTYTIPSNDDSLRSIGLIASVLGQAGKQGQNRRLTESEDGNVPWQTPADISKFIQSMTSRRGDILASLVDKDIAENKAEESSAEKAREPAAVPEVNPLEEVADETADEPMSKELMEEGDELLEQLAGNTEEMDAMSEVEKEILSMFAKEKAREEVTEGAIMSEVGVQKGVPEEAQAETKPAEEQAKAAPQEDKAEGKPAEQEAVPAQEQAKAAPQEAVPAKEQAKEAPEAKQADAKPAEAQKETSAEEQGAKPAADDAQEKAAPTKPGKDE